MRLTNSFILSGALLGTLIFAGACDDIPQEDRLIPVPAPTIMRNVLIQEFTGQRCPNCPEGAAAVHGIIDSYSKGSVVAVSLHPSGTTFTRPLGGLNLTSPTATAYYNYYRPAAFPSAVIDGSAPSSVVATWDGMVKNELEKSTPITIEATGSYDASTRKLTVDYSILFNDIMNSPANVNIWLLESGIVGAQYTNGPQNPEYVHNHVLRGSLTDDWGLPLGDTFYYSQNLTGSAEIVLDDKWVAENCSIVTFIQNPDSKFVYQVIESPFPATAAE